MSGCQQCLSGTPCDYALSLGDWIAKKEAALMHAEDWERRGGPSATLARQDAAYARNQLTAHKYGGIPPEEQERFCDCCGMRGVQHEPYDANRRFG